MNLSYAVIYDTRQERRRAEAYLNFDKRFGLHERGVLNLLHQLNIFLVVFSKQF